MILYFDIDFIGIACRVVVGLYLVDGVEPGDGCLVRGCDIEALVGVVLDAAHQRVCLLAGHGDRGVAKPHGDIALAQSLLVGNVLSQTHACALVEPSRHAIQ